MLKIITQLSMFLVGTLAQAQVSETREVAHFSKIVCKDGIEIVITQSDKAELVAQAQDALSLNDIVTEVKDNTLYVYEKEKSDATATVFISTSELSSLEVSGQSRVALTKEFNMPELSIALSGKSIFSGNVNAGKLDITLQSGSLYNGGVTAQAFTSNLSGKSTARLSGWAKSARISAVSGSVCLAKTLYASQAKLDASGHSAIAANVEYSVDADIAEGSQVSWAGYPKSVRLSENAEIVKSTITAVTGI